MTKDLQKPGSWRSKALIVAAVLGIASVAILFASKAERGTAPEVEQRAKANGAFRPTTAQWATLTVEPIQSHAFRSEMLTEGKIAVDEDRSTPIFSP